MLDGRERERDDAENAARSGLPLIPYLEQKGLVWAEYSIGELFDVVLSTDDLQPKNLEEGTMPLISSGSANNGICAYVDNSLNATVYQENSITVDMFGKAFFHSYKYFAVSHGRVNILLPKIPVLECAGLYLQSVIDTSLRKKYSYNSMCTSKKIVAEKIVLPSTVIHKPNLEFMEDFMKQKMSKKASLVESLFKLSKAEK